MAFCPSCGIGLDSPGATLSVSGTPKGLDWLAIAMACIICFYTLVIAWAIGKIFFIISAGVLIYKWDVIKRALWDCNIFKPFIVHFIWGLIVVNGFLYSMDSLFRGFYYGVGINPLKTQAMLIALLFVANLIYYIGFRIICGVYKKSKPQGQLVRLLVSMGLLIIYALAKRDMKALDTLLSSDDGVIAGTVTATPDIGSVDATSGCAVDATTTVSNVDMSNVGTFDDSVVSSNNTVQNTISLADSVPTTASDTTIHFTDSMTQPAGDISVHSDGSADFFDENMQYSGHMFSSGHLLDAMNLPAGRIEGNSIFDAQGTLAYTIDGNNIFDKEHQLAFTVRDGNIFDKLNQLVGSIK